MIWSLRIKCLANFYQFINRLVSLILLLLLSHQTLVVAQTNYYFSNAGSDSNNGKSPSSPFQSLSKLSAIYLQPGDSVLFRRGDTFRGSIQISQSGSSAKAIVYADYGSGQKPIIAGSTPVSNWTSVGGNIWQASCSSCGDAVTGVYQNGVSLPLGRYPNLDAPNKGYLTIRAHTDNYQIFSKEPLPTNIDFKGAEVVYRPTQWIINRAVVDHQYGDALNLITNSSYNLADGWGFFIQSHPATLDQNGEWYYNPTNKTIQLFSSQGNPNNQLITATTQGKVIYGTNIYYITIRNLQVTQSLNESVSLTNPFNLTLTNTDIINSGEDGLLLKGYGTNILIENNRITDVNNNGIYVDAFQNITFRGNSLRRIGTIAGRGKSGDGQYNGLQSTANQNVLIEKNIIDSVGYNGITFWNNTLIQQNVISNYCLVKSDGGGLYVFNSSKNPMSNIHLISNIVYNGIGAPEGSYEMNYSGANGIFLDDCVENVELRGNTVFNNHQWGIYLHATSNISVTDNTSFNNRVSQIVLYNDAGHCLILNNTVNNNVFVAKEIAQHTGQYEASDNDNLSQFGPIDYNYYVSPFNDTASIFGIKNYVLGGNFSLKGWQNFSGGLDLHSKTSPITYNQYKNEGSGGVTVFNSTFEVSSEGWELIYSRYGNAQSKRDDSNKLDGGSLNLSFVAPSGQSNSFAQVVKRIGKIVKGQTYVLRFDAIATVDVNILVYLRTYGPPFTEFDRRYTAAMSTTRKSFEFPFTASDNDTTAIILFQIDGEGPSFWIDNVRLQQGVPIQNKPDDFIKLYYNPTLKDSTIALVGPYRDAKNQSYSNSITLKPFTSIILLKDTLPVSSADLSLYLYGDKRPIHVNEQTTLRLRIQNQGNTNAALARWVCRLPAYMNFIDNNGQPYTDNVLTGSVQQLAPFADTTFVLVTKPTTNGLFRVAAQISTATSPDPDSRPDSGTGDGEDDSSTAELRVGEPVVAVYESPNPNQRLLPSTVSDQPTPNAGLADLSLRMDASRRRPAVGDIITITLYVNNIGGKPASGVKLQNQLPNGLDLVNSPNWSSDGKLISITLDSVGIGTTSSVSFQARVSSPGYWINKAQIFAASPTDPDSTAGNGFDKGEDDESQIDIQTP